jgi:hypothetical protein
MERYKFLFLACQGIVDAKSHNLARNVKFQNPNVKGMPNGLMSNRSKFELWILKFL